MTRAAVNDFPVVIFSFAHLKLFFLPWKPCLYFLLTNIDQLTDAVHSERDLFVLVLLCYCF